MFYINNKNIEFFFCEFEEGEPEDDMDELTEYSFWKPIPVTSYINFIFESGNAETGPAITPTLAQYLMSPTELVTRADRECKEVGLDKGYFIPFKYAMFYNKYICIMEGPELNFFIKEIPIFVKDFFLEIIKEYFMQELCEDIIYSFYHFVNHHFLFAFSGQVAFYKLHLYIIFLIQNRYNGISMPIFIKSIKGNLLPFFTKKGTRRKYV